MHVALHAAVRPATVGALQEEQRLVELQGKKESLTQEIEQLEAALPQYTADKFDHSFDEVWASLLVLPT